MATSIGKLALQLTASPAGLIAGLNTGLKKVDNFAAGVGKTLGALANPPALKSLQGSFNKAFSSLRDPFADIVDQTKMADKLGLSTQAFVAFSSVGGTSADNVSGAFLAFQRVLGKTTLQAEGVGGAADDLGGHLDGLTDKAGQSGKGLARWGLDINELAKMPFEDALKAVAEKFKDIPDPVERAALATSVFLKKGQDMIQFLAGGAAGMERMKEKAALLGISFSRFEAAGVMQASSALKTIDLAFKGIKTQMAIQLAPLVAGLTEGFTGWLKSVGGIPAIVKKVASAAWTVADAVLAIVEGLASVIDLLSNGKKSLGKLGTITEFALKGQFDVKSASELVGALGKKEGEGGVAEGLSKLRQKFKDLRGEMDATKEAAPSLADSLGKQLWLAKKFGLPPEIIKKLQADLSSALAGEQATSGLKGITEQANQLTLAADEAAKALKRQVDTFGLDETGQKLFDIEQKRLALTADMTRMTDLARDADRLLTDQQKDELKGKLRLAEVNLTEVNDRVDLIRTMGDQLAAMHKHKEMMDKARALTTEMATPLEQWTTRTDELTKMLQSGAIGWDVYKRAVDKATESLTSATQARDQWNAGAAVLEGTSAAISAMNQARFGDRLSAGGNRAEQLLAEQKAIMERQQAALLGILNAAKDGGAAVLDALKGAKNFLPGG